MQVMRGEMEGLGLQNGDWIWLCPQGRNFKQEMWTSLSLNFLNYETQ